MYVDHLNEILSSANMGRYSNHSLNMVIEQSPCNSCSNLKIIHEIANLLPTFNFYCQSLMCYLHARFGTDFLERLIASRAVVLKDDLKPFSNRQDCMTRGCKHTTCHHGKECHYSKPNKVLDVYYVQAVYPYCPNYTYACILTIVISVCCFALHM